MFRFILPQHPMGRLYVGTVAVIASIGVAITVGSLAADRLFRR